MISLEIPDPFQTFVAKKYKDYKGYVYDFFTGEWSFKCLSCGEPLDAPSKKIMTSMVYVATHAAIRSLQQRQAHRYACRD